MGGPYVNEEVNVTRWADVTTGHGAEDAYVIRPMPRGNAQDLHTFFC
jgi:hypothetical protein